jgi:hypothetical protein
LNCRSLVSQVSEKFRGTGKRKSCEHKISGCFDFRYAAGPVALFDGANRIHRRS